MENALEPISPADFGEREAAHLLRRTVIGPRLSECTEAYHRGLDETIELLLQPVPLDLSLVQHLLHHKINAGVEPNTSSRNFDYFEEKARHYTNFRQWICTSIVTSPLSLHWRMALLWHMHFPVSCNGAHYAEHTLDMFINLYNGSLGNVRTLTKTAVMSTAMQNYLSGTTNWWAPWGSGVNENLARELMEIHMLGRTQADGSPNYSLADIKRIGHALTGYRIHEEWAYNEDGTRTCMRDRNAVWQKDLWFDRDNEIFGVTGRFEPSQVSDVIFQAKAEQVATHFARKLCEEFVGRPGEVTEAEVRSVASELLTNEWDITATLKTLLKSKLFFDDRFRMRLIRSPLHLLLGTFRTFSALEFNQELRIDHLRQTDLIRRLSAFGHSPFDPPNVSGWRKDSAWLTSSDIDMRFMFCQRFAEGDIHLWDAHWTPTVYNYNPIRVLHGVSETRGTEYAVEALAQCLIGEVDPSVRDLLVQSLRSSGPLDTGVRLAIRHIIGSPRYQLY